MPRPFDSHKSSWEKKGERLGGSIGAIASKVKGIIEELNVEHKHCDVLTSTAATTVGVVIPLLPIAQGLGSSDRTGNSIKPVSFLMRYGIAAGLSNCHCRVMIFRDNQQISDTSPTVADVLQNSDVYSPLDAETNVGRFSIMYDKVHNLVVGGDTAQTNIIKVFKKLNKRVKYNSSATTDIQKNGMYLAFISDNANNPQLTARCRTRFVDN